MQKFIIVALCLLYITSPIDFLPDVIPVLGRRIFVADLHPPCAFLETTGLYLATFRHLSYSG